MTIKTTTYDVKLAELVACEYINQDLLFACIADYFFPARPPLVTTELCDFINTNYPVTGRRRGGKIEIIAGLRQFQLLALNPEIQETEIPVRVVDQRLTKKQIREIAFHDLVLSQVLFSSRKPFDMFGILINGCEQPSFAMEPVFSQLTRTEIATFFGIKVQTLKQHLDKDPGQYSPKIS